MKSTYLLKILAHTSLGANSILTLSDYLTRLTCGVDVAHRQVQRCIRPLCFSLCKGWLDSNKIHYG